MPELLRAAAALAGAFCAWAAVTWWLQRPRRSPAELVGAAAHTGPAWITAGLTRILPAFQVRPARRTRQDAAGLELALLTLASELEAGVGLLEALRRVHAHLPAATAADLRAALEDGAPRDGVEAICRWADRTREPVLQDLASTLALHQGTGGPLGAVLRRLAEISRRRRLLAAQLQSRTAEARLSALILAATPGVLVLLVGMGRPELLAPLWSDPAGRVALVYGLCSWAAGVTWIRAMLAGAGGLGE